MNKALSLLKFQLKVLGAYFKNPSWTPAKAKEFFLYLFYYATNFWYYVFLTFLEALYLNKNPKLKEVDNKITQKYQDSNQFWISLVQSYSQKKEKISNLTYGETSYFAIKTSLEFIGLKPEDKFIDLGCGTGKTVFLANTVFGANATGVDLIPDFIKNANDISKDCDLKNIKFIEKNIFDFNLKEGNVFYITPTCFDQETMQKLFKYFEKLPKGSKLIVLTKNIQAPNLKLLGYKNLWYSWGKAMTFYYEVV